MEQRLQSDLRARSAANARPPYYGQYRGGVLFTGQRFIDVGTGPGLPGIPLAIVRPAAHFTLLDSLGKRVRFLRQVQYELQLENISPVQSRVEDFLPSRHSTALSAGHLLHCRIWFIGVIIFPLHHPAVSMP